jgi:hypothetical protein
MLLQRMSVIGISVILIYALCRKRGEILGGAVELVVDSFPLSIQFRENLERTGLRKE